MSGTSRSLFVSLGLSVLLLGAAPHPARAGTFGIHFGHEPRSGRDWYERGMDRHNDGRYEAAIEAFHKSIAAGYREGAASYNIACGYALLGKPDDAFTWLDKAAATGFDVAEAVEDDDDLDALRKDPRFEKLREHLGSAEPSGHPRDRARALARFDRLTAASPGSGHDLFETGMQLLNAKEFDKSAAAFRAAADKDYRPGTSLYNAACALSRKGDKAAALDLLARAIEAGFDDPHHMDRDDDLDNIRHEPRFRELRRTARELELPAALDGWWTRIFGGVVGHDWEDLADRYRAYVRATPSSGRGWFDLGYAALQVDAPREARDAFQKALDLGYRKPTTMYDLACAYARLHQKDAAFEWLFKSIDAGFDTEGRLWADRDLRTLRSDPRFRKAERMAERRDGGNQD